MNIWEHVASLMGARYFFDGVTTKVSINKNEKVSGTLECIKVDDNISISLNQLKVNEVFTFPLNETKAFVEMNFVLCGCELSAPNEEDGLSLSKGYCRTYFNNSTKNYQIYPVGGSPKWLTLFIDKQGFREMMPEMGSFAHDRFEAYARLPYNISQKGFLPLTIHSLIEEIWDNKDKGLMRTMKLKANAYQLVTEVLKNALVLIHERPSEKYLSNEDIDKLHDARNYINKHFGNPLTLKELSRKVCLNEFKLKKGFKAFFNTTVHNYLINKRMEFSKDLLRKKKVTVEQVAMEAGYKCTSKFIETFKKHNGVTPGHYRRIIN
ncbi:helix-turn-helix transcriptional regulator [Xanthovirga aplysinae]|uniref:helix-turn-helix transcriptional regulator n=1 Tax=Xanthovirga aplysinae TaxID=2529853 RepID=UPI0012BCAE0B|nr:AraC family transcriptional regulator [Xanthovirga aplysinae]MTI33270.1 AraC family transcriptional regulator [Xanthovirga aplysinae]